MDLWNNAVGREVAQEVRKEIKGTEQYYTKEQVEDMVAIKIRERIKAGELITSLNDKRDFQSSKHNGRVYTQEEINPKNMRADEFKLHEKHIMKDMEEGKILSNSKANEQVQNGSLMYVENYIREDGTKVKGYYRTK